MTSTQTQNTRETFKAVADKFGAEKARELFQTLMADPVKLADAYNHYIFSDLRQRWSDVYALGETVNRRAGGTEGGWVSRTTQMRVGETWFEASEYSSEVKTVRILRQYHEAEGDYDEGFWVTVWDEETQS